MRGLVPLRDAAAARAVHADRVNLIDVGQRVVFLGKVADRVDRGDVTVHRIHAFERDQLGASRVFSGEQLLEMSDVVVAEHALLAAGITDPCDHAGVVELVGEDHAAGEQLGECRKRGVVRDIAAGEEQRRFLAVQIGKLRLELDVIMCVAADVAGAAAAGADIVQRLLHGGDDLGVLAHGEVIVRAPHCHRLGPVMAREATRVGERTLVAQDIDEDAVASLLVQPVDRLVEDVIVVHRRCRP